MSTWQLTTSISNPPTGLRNVSIPPELRSHPLIADKFFYTLPKSLLEAVQYSIKRHARFDSADWKMELQLSEVTAGYPDSVGFHNGQHLTFSYLHPKKFDEACRQMLAKMIGAARADATVRQMTEELKKLNDSYRAYLGWLMTNSQFFKEHAQLLAHTADAYWKYGIPQTPFAMPPNWTEMLPPSSGETELLASADQAVKEFCERWRLQKIAGPFLPEPLPVQIPTITAPLGQVSALQHGMRIIAIPDVLPLPDGYRIQNWFENAAVSASSDNDDHLTEWFAISSQHNFAKQSFGRYQRLFSLQHYFRILLRRHPQLVPRNQEALRRAFAVFFGKGEDAIKKDLSDISKRMGKDWAKIGPPF